MRVSESLEDVGVGHGISAIVIHFQIIEDDSASIVRDLRVRVGSGFVGARVEVKAA